MFLNDKINVFISYSWDSEEHKQWVYKLARDLENSDIHIIIDRIYLKSGHHKLFFMEKAIKGSDFVLMIITKRYHEKASMRIGGVGYEYNIINHELYSMITNNEKFIPIVRQTQQNIVIPDFLNEFLHIEMSNDLEYNSKLLELIRRIKNIQLTIADFIDE